MLASPSLPAGAASRFSKSQSSTESDIKEKDPCKAKIKIHLLLKDGP